MNDVKQYLADLGVAEQEALEQCLDHGKLGALHVARLIGGQVISTYDGTYDVHAGNIRVEVKTSVAKPRYKTEKNGSVYRACFSKLNGSNNSKTFDAEILLAMWPDEDAWYFLLSRDDTLLFNKDERTGSRQIAVTKGTKAWGKSAELIQRFQISREDLCRVFSKQTVKLATIPEKFHAMRAKIVSLNKLKLE